METPGHHIEIPDTKRLVIASGSHYPEFADRIAESIGTQVTPITHKQFSNSELHCKFEDNIRGADVFLVQTFASAENWSTNDALVELMIMNDAALRASAGSITNVVPWFPYARQDRKHTPRVPISASAVANALLVSGGKKFERFVSADLHADQIQGMVQAPFDQNKAKRELQQWVREAYVPSKAGEDIVFMAPDATRVGLVAEWAEDFGYPLAFNHKTRGKEDPSQVRIERIIGSVANSHCVIIDDMIDTGGTIAEAAEEAFSEGALSVTAIATHLVLSKDAAQKMKAAGIERLVGTDTFPSRELEGDPWLVKRTLAPLIGQTILEIFKNGSVTKLF